MAEADRHKIAFGFYLSLVYLNRIPGSDMASFVILVRAHSRLHGTIDVNYYIEGKFNL